MLAAIFSLLGTGQRSPLVLFAIVLATFAYLVSGRRVTGKTVFAVFFVFVPVITLATAVLGRSGAGNSSVLGLLGEFLQRILASNQTSSVVGWRYIYRRGPQETFGGEWLESLQGLLPGSAGSTLANEIFAVLYGSDRGTSPPSLWGSIYYNFGYSGIAVAPVILAMIFAGVTRLGTRSKERNTLELIGIAGVFATIGTWVAGTPVYLLNTGIAVYAVVWVIGSRQSLTADPFGDAKGLSRRRRSRRPRPRPRPRPRRIVAANDIHAE
ncbi:hypothetical protein GCM10009737_16830 [Nocardioides lentus]|uniref:Oligosaccharide repeat unit polymerase n=1 Tax=Nocardioides lentus TaxID=338077 RepID=A0ABN2P9M2_9ACTN